MKTWILGAAAAAAIAVLSAAGPAQARMANPSLAASPLAETDVQPAHYRSYRHYHRRYDRRRDWRRHSYRHRYRHCWNERVRVRTPIGSFVYRTHRRCGWRYRYY